ncbi:MAG TPA: hypothetical protein VJM53_00125 [Burkholderiales bacterium]|nr:hypothetical protein [Burkholderiales bacterium]
MRRYLVYLLMLCLPLQSFAALAPFEHGGTSDLLHEMHHDQQLSHHHDEHGQMQHDRSQESDEHMADHACCHAALAFFSFISFKMARPESASPPTFRAPYVGDADLEQPQRPPRTFA